MNLKKRPKDANLGLIYDSLMASQYALMERVKKNKSNENPVITKKALSIKLSELKRKREKQYAITHALAKGAGISLVNDPQLQKIDVEIQNFKQELEQLKEMI